ncbi:hypothetical protein JQ574_17500 [Bradyrhizobium sp. AUGA SZCCT0158]|uniref:hypothetical protein n=1 Tax=Bradyrhizobium sp. AUGA SZCCT0158 TaxID=2807661 RepID=UPI001BA626A7|nr:hypothetical protein [Bradyrhizobium sp. AUGA SZCCT0158]MBR1197794.1 hypothetical protein [Bradyrhizobium sp. AUGA SZCCT0158]
MTKPLDETLEVVGFRGAQTADQIEARFIDFARDIMGSHDLVHGERRWKVTAIELYLCSRQSFNGWRDPYTHANPEQLKAGTWYVHDEGTRAPTYSGIDITCGSDDDGIHGGILVRELSGEHRWVFQRIIRGDRESFPRKGNVWSDDEKKIVRSIHGTNIHLGPLRLVRRQEQTTPLYIGPRIGLRPKPNSGAEDVKTKAFRLAALRIATSRTAVGKMSMTEIDLGVRKMRPTATS